MIKIGCCGFNISREKYYKIFDIVEVQSTFYKIPEEKTLENGEKRLQRVLSLL